MHGWKWSGYYSVYALLVIQTTEVVAEERSWPKRRCGEVPDLATRHTTPSLPPSTFADAQQHLQGFVQPQGPLNIDAIANNVVQTGAIQEIANCWKLAPNVAMDLCQIALFNVVMLIDDSGSMHAEKGERIKDVSA